MSHDATNGNEGGNLVSVSNKFDVLASLGENENIGAMFSNPISKKHVSNQEKMAKMEIRLKNITKISEVETEFVDCMFEKTDSPMDGHCLLHSVIASLEFQKKKFLYYKYLLYKIRNEVNNNVGKYVDFISSKCPLQLRLQMCAYIDAFNYDTQFGDILPLVLSNILQMSIGIFEKIDEDYRFIKICENQQFSETLYIMKNNDHYDSLKILTSSTEMTRINCQSGSQSSMPHCSSVNSGTETNTRGNKSGKTITSLDELQLLVWNIHGIDETKISILEDYLQPNHIICLGETWTPCENENNVKNKSKNRNMQQNKSKKLELKNFEYFQFSRKYKHKKAWRAAGGQGIFIRKDILDGVKIVKNYDDVLVWIRLFKEFFQLDKDIYLGSVYIYPENSLCTEEDQFQIVQQAVCELPQDIDPYLFGDLNSRIKDMLDYVIDGIHGSDGPLSDMVDSNPYGQESVYSYLNKINRLKRQTLDNRPKNKFANSLRDLCITSNMFILNGRFGNEDHGFHTRIDTTGLSLVDYVLCTPNSHTLVKNFYVDAKLPESDHLPLRLVLKIGKSVENNICYEPGHKWSPIYKYIWKKEDLPILKTNITDNESILFRDLFRNSIYELTDVQNVTRLFSEYVGQACNRTFSTKKVNINLAKKPDWFDGECANKRRELKCADRMIDSEEKENLMKDLCRDYRSTRQRKTREHNRDCTTKLENAFSNSPNEMWKTLSQISKSFNTNCPTGEEFVLHYQKLSIAPEHETFDDSYEKEVELFLKKYDSKEITPTNTNELELSVLNSDFTVDEISSCIDSLKNNKSAGIDMIPAEFLKACKEELLEDITMILNYFIDNENFPEQWSEGIRSSIHKAGSKLDTGNYRGITVLPVFEKIFETAVQRRLEFIDKAFCRTDKYNGGFAKDSQTSDNIFILNALIRRQLLLNKGLIIIWVDFKQAFDFMNRAITFYKIIQSGLHGRVINTLRNLYTKTVFRVKHEGKLSEKIRQFIGVNQGGNASPTIFKKYLCDMKEYLREYTGVVLSDDEILVYLLWADDLINVSTNVQDAQKQLDGVAKFASKNKAIANSIKTKFTVFGNIKNVKLYFNGKAIEEVPSYKYLGNIFASTKTNKGDPFSENYQYLYDKAQKNIFSLFSKTKDISPLSPKLRIYLFDSLIRPVLIYGSGVWGISKKGRDTMDKLHLWYMRIVLGVKYNSNILATLGECGSLPPSINILANTFSYFIRLKNMPPTSLPYQAFSESKRLHNIGFSTWYSNVIKLASDYEVDLDTMNKYSIKYHLALKYKENWLNQINDLTNNSSLRTYCQLKTEFKLDPYLTLIKNYKYRNALSRLRVNSHLLEIERGRHTEPATPVDRRLCSYCSVVETEYHLVTECLLHDTDRQFLFSNISDRFPEFTVLDNVCKFKFMLTFPDEQLLSSVGKFVFKCFEKRKIYSEIQPS